MEDSIGGSKERSYVECTSSARELDRARAGGGINNWPGSCPNLGEEAWETVELEMFMDGSGRLGLIVGTGN